MILFYVQHLLGTGHLQRIVSVARATARRGAAVCVVSGGMPVPGLRLDGVELVQLPPLRSSDRTFSGLVDAGGKHVDEPFRRARAAQLAGIIESRQPRLAVVETFPFGRRQLRFELLPLLRSLHGRQPRPPIVCSIRDILQRSRKPSRVDEITALLAEYFDAVLVHGDPDFLALTASFPAERIPVPLVYTGFVSHSQKTPARPDNTGDGEVLVSAGGGNAAGRLFRAALEASGHVRNPSRRWRMLVGYDVESLDTLRREAPPTCLVEANRGDFRDLLARCAVSVSQSGYNTAIDVMQSGARAVLVPFEGEGETEQLTRARRLQALGRARIVRETELTAESLAAAVDAALALPPPGPAAYRFDGADVSAAWLSERAAASR